MPLSARAASDGRVRSGFSAGLGCRAEVGRAVLLVRVFALVVVRFVVPAERPPDPPDRLPELVARPDPRAAAGAFAFDGRAAAEVFPGMSSP
jgi:hypothetical protein